MTATTHDLLVQYLLGDLPAAMREQVEQDYFASDQLWEELQQAETDLIDSYAAGNLSDAQREQFERFYLTSPERRKRVSAAQSLMDPAIREELASSLSQSSRSETSSPSARFSWPDARRIWNFLSAPATVLLTIAVAVLWMENHLLRSQLQSTQAKLPHQQQHSNQVDGGRTTTETASPPAVVLLEPGLLRSGTRDRAQSVSAADGQSSIVLMLDLRQDRHPVYDVVVQTAEGHIVQRLTRLHSQPIPHGRIITIEFPSSQLPLTDYIVTLFGSGQPDPVDSYVFHVGK